MDYLMCFPVFIILIPFMSAFVMPLLKDERWVKYVSLVSSFTCFILSISTFYYVSVNGAFKYDMGHFKAPLGIELKIGIFESVMAIVFTFVAFIVIWHSICNVQNDITPKKAPIYYLLINVFNASICGITFTNDIFNAFVFIEVTTLAACGMIIVKDKGENIVAAIKYLVYSSLGSGLILMGIAFIYSITGNLNMDYIHRELLNVYMEYDRITIVSLSLFTFGIGGKGAMFPFHVWLPDAHSSSSDSTSAVISAIGLKGPAILLIKVFYTVFGADITIQSGMLQIVLVMGAVGMIMGSVFALFQDNIKRMVAYSSVAQMGYVFLGIGLGNTLGLVIAVFHMMTHALTKSMLFLSAGAMIKKAGTYSTKGMGAIGNMTPVYLGVFTVGALSMVGIPVLPGFITKWNISMASIESGRTFMVAAVAVSSVLNCIYYIPVVVNGYFKKSVEGFDSKEALAIENKLNFMPCILLAVSVVLLGTASGKVLKALTLAFEKTI